MKYDPVHINMCVAMFCLFLINLVFMYKVAHAHCNFVRAQQTWNDIVMGFIARQEVKELVDGPDVEADLKMFDEDEDA